MTIISTNQLVQQLKALKKAVLKDGVIDWDETEQLREAIRPLAVRRGFIFEDYERLLMKCRKDFKITPQESRELALQLDLLCHICTVQQLKFWLVIVLAVLAITCSTVLINRITSSTDTSAFREISPSISTSEHTARP